MPHVHVQNADAIGNQKKIVEEGAKMKAALSDEGAALKKSLSSLVESAINKMKTLCPPGNWLKGGVCTK